MPAIIPRFAGPAAFSVAESCCPARAPIVEDGLKMPFPTAAIAARIPIVRDIKANAPLTFDVPAVIPIDDAGRAVIFEATRYEIVAPSDAAGRTVDLFVAIPFREIESEPAAGAVRFPTALTDTFDASVAAMKYL
jgi:hypothetical protein